MSNSSFGRGPCTACIFITMFTCASVLYCQPNVAKSKPAGGFCVRGGVGTDLQLGLGFGIGAAYIWNFPGRGAAFELGADFYYHHSTDKYTDQRGSVTVTGEDKTTLIVFGVRANALFNYNPNKRNVYFIVGFGFVVASLQWEENENAPNWTAPYHDKADGTSVGNIVNLGVGVPLSTDLDVRLETPMLYFYSAAGKSASFAPTATIGLAYRF